MYLIIRQQMEFIEYTWQSMKLSGPLMLTTPRWGHFDVSYESLKIQSWIPLIIFLERFPLFKPFNSHFMIRNTLWFCFVFFFEKGKIIFFNPQDLSRSSKVYELV